MRQSSAVLVFSLVGAGTLSVLMMGATLRHPPAPHAGGGLRRVTAAGGRVELIDVDGDGAGDGGSDAERRDGAGEGESGSERGGEGDGQKEEEGERREAGGEAEGEGQGGRPPHQQGRGGLQELPPGAELILDAPLDLGDTSTRDNCRPTGVTFQDETPLNEAFIRKLDAVFRRLRVHWWLDEGGLIGASRAGAMQNADDDFDFMALLPHQIHPCSPDTFACDDPAAFSDMIHDFLTEFWKEGMCVNNYHPDRRKYNASRKLMYSFMLDRSRVYQPKAKLPGARCFEHGKHPHFAHMHLGMLTEKGELATNIWAPPLSKGGHPHDLIPLTAVLPPRRCRAGRVDAPCPNDIEAFLKLRNEGEYAGKTRRDTSKKEDDCLLVRKKWSREAKERMARTTEELHRCGYNSMHSMVAAARRSDFTSC